MNKEETVIKAVIETVPQWYLSAVGPHIHEMSARGMTVRYCSHRKKTPQLRQLSEYAERALQGWMEQVRDTPTPSDIGKIKEDLALCWLSMHGPGIAWSKLLAYVEGLKFRTYENRPVALHLVIDPAGSGSVDLTERSLQKVLDPLASSQQVYLKCDREIRFLDYRQITWDETKDEADYKFNPEFLQPFKSILQPEEFSFHLTSRGDVIVMSEWGLLASHRKGAWYLYDAPTLKNTIVDALGHYRVGCNLFEVLFDLSYRRHGGLLVYDPGHTVLDHVINAEAVIVAGRDEPDLARSMLSPAVGSIGMSHPESKRRQKRIFLEIAGIDGAVIFDGSQVLAFGAMIETHPGAGGHAGATATAAHSAYLWGGRPSYVSSDGDICILFRSSAPNGRTADVALRFM